MTTLRARSLIGQRGSSMGFWASPASKDVRTASDEDLLVSTSNNVTNLSYISKGQIHLSPFASLAVRFSGYAGKLFNPSPIVWAQPYDAVRKNLLVPSLQPNSPFESFTGFPPRYRIEPESSTVFQSDALRIENLKNLAYNLQFIVFAVSGE